MNQTKVLSHVYMSYKILRLFHASNYPLKNVSKKLSKCDRGWNASQNASALFSVTLACQQDVSDCQGLVATRTLGSFLTSKEIPCVAYVWPMHNLQRTTSWCLLLREQDDQFVRAGLSSFSLFLSCASQSCCHWECTKEPAAG